MINNNSLIHREELPRSYNSFTIDNSRYESPNLSLYPGLLQNTTYDLSYKTAEYVSNFCENFTGKYNIVKKTEEEKEEDIYGGKIFFYLYNRNRKRQRSKKDKRYK